MAETTSNVLLTYDIDALHDSAVYKYVKNCMREKGYYDVLLCMISGDKRAVDLPNTTLWRPNTTNQKANNDMNACIEKYNKEHNKKHSLEKFIAVRLYVGIFVISREPTREELRTIPTLV